MIEKEQIEKAELLIKNIKKFRRWAEMGTKKTQKGGTIGEEYIEDAIYNIYDNAKMYKMGSQEHPDFMVIPKNKEESIELFNKEMIKNKKGITLNVLEEWEKSKHNKEKIRIIRVEIKTTKSNKYMLNDTFPSPYEILDEIYVLFSKKEKKIIITTSFTMAEQCKVNPPISLREKKSKKKLENIKKSFKKIWEGTGITTAPRPTYAMDNNYFNIEATPERIATLFKEGGF